MMRIKIAIRNILRNRRRSLINIVMISAGFCGIVTFRGFASYVVGLLQDSAIDNQYGHIQIAKDNFWEKSSKDSFKDRLIDQPEVLRKKLSALPGVKYVSGRTQIYALLSSSEQTLTAVGIGFDPGVDTKLRDSFEMTEGEKLTDPNENEIIVGSTLAKEGGFKSGDQVTLVGYTIDGGINAVDATLKGLFVTGLVEIDNSFFFAPLSLVNKLIDTDRTEKLVMVLNKTDGYRGLASTVTQDLPSGLIAKTWYDLAAFFRQVLDYYEVYNGVIEVIVLILTALSILNTTGMSVFERTGEIGTLRAMGDEKGEIILQFMLEGLTLALVGTVVGVGLAFGVAQLFNALELPIVMPGTTAPVPIMISILPQSYFLTLAFNVVTVGVATLLPAYRASQLEIVDALRKNT